MGCGAQYVTISGISEMHKWYVDNWDMMDVSYTFLQSFFYKMPLPDFLCHFTSIYSSCEVQGFVKSVTNISSGFRSVPWRRKSLNFLQS